MAEAHRQKTDLFAIVFNPHSAHFAAIAAIALFTPHATLYGCAVSARALETGPNFRITVADRGQPIAGLALHIGRMHVNTNREGVASFRKVAPGHYNVVVDRDDGVPDAVEINVKMTGPTNIQIHLQWPAVAPLEVRSLKGTLNSATNSSGAFSVSLLEGISGRTLQRAALPPSGAFNFPNLAPGLYFLRVRQLSRNQNELAIDGLIGIQIEKKASNKPLQLDLGMTSCGLQYTNAAKCVSSVTISMRTASGEVVDGMGAAVGNSRLVLTSGGSAPRASTVTDAAGHFTFADLPAGDYSLEVISPSFSPARATLHLDPAATNRNIRFLQVTLGLPGACSTVRVSR